jgi:hypothetical protein
MAEIDEFLPDPTTHDTDRDGIPDGYEINIRCVNPLIDEGKVVNFIDETVNSVGRNYDNDGTTNLKEFNQRTSHCVS